MKYLYPCTGKISAAGFGEYLEENIKESRRNINLFARELSARFDIPYISLVNSGSSANLAASLAMAEKLRKAGKPLVAAISAFTFPTTVSSLLLAGFRIKMIDVEQNGFNMDPEKLEESIEGVSLIVPTHFLGFPAGMERISETAKKHGCLILQDACETIELRDKSGKQYYTYGDITTWSFYHPHHLSSYGGGAVITLNKEDAMLIDSICHWGRACKCHIDPALCTNPPGPGHQFTYERIGANLEISELNACFGRWQFRSFDEYEKRRTDNYAVLYEALKSKKSIQVFPHPSAGGSMFVFPIKMKSGMTVKEAHKYFSSKGLEIRTLMGGVTNEQKAFSFISDTIYENAHEMAEHTFFVGIHQTITTSCIHEMAKIISEFFE